MSPDEAMERITVVLSHAWMVRTFLKHAEEIQEDEEMMQVHRTIFDYTRAVEPSFQRKDAKEFLRRARGKLPKLRAASESFARGYRRIIDHTNYEMASRSLGECVRQIETILQQATSDRIQSDSPPENDQPGQSRLGTE